jgi:PTH1 family peptidyl-tRNA hydrolase
MKLFVGLGNPGSDYARHRHNVGFVAVERIAEHHGLGPWKKRFHGLACDGVIAGRKVALLKPQTYMNDSGRSVGEAMRYLKIAPEDVIVFHDELDLAPSKIKVKRGGGNAGHNGLRSISAHIGNEYERVRIGIGHPGSKELVHGYVLHDFAKADAAWLRPLLDAIAEASGRLAAGDAARFLTDVSRGQRANDEPALEAAPRPVAAKKEPAHAGAGHPAGERQAKRAGALADNLKRWLTGRRKEN